MKPFVLATACAATLLSLPASSVPQTADSGSTGLVRVPPPGQEAFDGAAWADRLTDPDLDRREGWYDQLVQRAIGSEAVRKWLRDQATGDPTLELTWTSRLALREAEQHASATPSDGGPWRVAPGQAAQGWDPWQWLDQMQRSLQSFGGPSMGAPFPTWTAPGPGAGAQGGNFHSEEQAFRMEQGPDGVRIEVRELVDGKEQVKTYEADTLEELLEAHPELRDRIGTWSGPDAGPRLHALQGFSPWQGLGRPLGSPLGRPWWGAQVPPEAMGEIRTDVLGVYPRRPTAEEAQRLGLEEDTGLLVVRVEPMTIAHAIGLAPGDVVLEVNGAPITRIEDISGALAARPESGEVTVTWVDGFGRRRSGTWRPTASETGSDADRRDV